MEAGIAAFAAQGYHEASMAAIAREAGLSVGVLYKYYENKDALFDACLRHSLAALEALLQEVTARRRRSSTMPGRSSGGFSALPGSTATTSACTTASPPPAATRPRPWRGGLRA